MNPTQQPAEPSGTQPAQPAEPQATPPASPAAPNPTVQKTNTMAIIALVLAFIVPLVGLILGIVSLSQIKKRNEKGTGLAFGAIGLSVIFMIVQIIILLVFIGVSSVQKSQREKANQPSTTSTNSTTSSYQGVEGKAYDQAVRFLEGLRDNDFNQSYSQLGPELKKKYTSAQDFASQLKSKRLNLIRSWEVTSVKSTTSSDGTTEITVKGTVKADSSNSTGTFEFGFYKDTDGSADMLSYNISPD